MKIIAIIIATIVLIIDLVTDYKAWLKNRNEIKPKGSVKHRYGAVLRIAGLAIPLWLAWWKLSIVICADYWALFDTAFAISVGQKWYWTGATAWLDRMQANYPVIKWLKYLLAIILTCLYIFEKLGLTKTINI